MTKLEKLPEYTDSVMHGLTAGQALKQRILETAAESALPNKKKSLLLNPVPVLCSLAAVLLIFSVLLNGIQSVSVSDQGKMTVFTAGNNQTVSPDISLSFEVLMNEKKPDAVTRIELDNGTVIGNPSLCAELFTILKNNALSTDTRLLPESNVITIVLNDGSSVQVEAFAPWLTDGKSFWTCQPFFDKLNQLAQ